MGASCMLSCFGSTKRSCGWKGSARRRPLLLLLHGLECSATECGSCAPGNWTASCTYCQTAVALEIGVLYVVVSRLPGVLVHVRIDVHVRFSVFGRPGLSLRGRTMLLLPAGGLCGFCNAGGAGSTHSDEQQQSPSKLLHVASLLSGGWTPAGGLPHSSRCGLANMYPAVCAPSTPRRVPDLPGWNLYTSSAADGWLSILRAYWPSSHEFASLFSEHK